MHSVLTSRSAKYIIIASTLSEHLSHVTEQEFNVTTQHESWHWALVQLSIVGQSGESVVVVDISPSSSVINGTGSVVSRDEDDCVVTVIGYVGFLVVNDDVMTAFCSLLYSMVNSRSTTSRISAKRPQAMDRTFRNL